MIKTDFKKQDKALYSGKVGRIDLVNVPQQSFLMIDGAGNPGTAPAYGRAVAALYGLSYGLKFHGKLQGVDHVVPPLEGLWWADDMDSFVTRDKDKWLWTMMIRQPDWVTATDLAQVLESVISKTAKKRDATTDETTLRKVRLEAYCEGQVVQVLHIGSYDQEGPVLADMHNRFIPENGVEMRGLHHEIYLGDPRKVAPEKLKTILRQPVSQI